MAEPVYGEDACVAFVNAPIAYLSNRDSHYSSSVERATTSEEFLAKPEGRYLVGGSWLYFHARCDLVGFVLWSRPTEDDLRGLVDDQEVLERMDLLWDALTSLRKSMSLIHDSLKGR